MYITICTTDILQPCTCISHHPLFWQVTLPVAITPRYSHFAIVFGSGQGFRVVILFGGRNSSYDAISGTTLLLLGECTISMPGLLNFFGVALQALSMY